MELCSVLRGSLMEGRFGGERIHVHVWLSPFTVHLKLSQHCWGYTPIQNKKLKIYLKIYTQYRLNCPPFSRLPCSLSLFQSAHDIPSIWIMFSSSSVFACLHLMKFLGLMVHVTSYRKLSLSSKVATYLKIPPSTFPNSPFTTTYCNCRLIAWSVGEGNGNPLQYSYLENPMDRGAW